MKKFFTIFAILITVCAVAQRNPQHNQHSQHSQQTNRRVNFSQTKEHKQFKFSKHSKEVHERSQRFYGTIVHRQIGTTIYINNHFERFDCSWHEPCYREMIYPDHYSTFGRGIVFPMQHIVWYEVPVFPDWMTIEFIDPEDVVVFEGNNWMYLRDYYRLRDRF